MLDKSPTIFIRNIRLERAALLIKHGNMSIGEIADAVGFCSSSYMSSVFKRNSAVNRLNTSDFQHPLHLCQHPFCGLLEVLN